ncbi:4-Cys prefix domain-containing protein [Tychonema bourrellyi]
MSPQPCYCINPTCQRPDHRDNNNSKTLYCLSCGGSDYTINTIKLWRVGN